MLMGDGILELGEEIQILRAETPLLHSDYYPITDWYYCDEVMQDMFPHSLALDEADLLETKEFQKKYLSVQKRLTLTTVGNCLAEMHQGER